MPGGRSVGGRSLGLASGFALASTAFFVVEMRQAGNDGFLTLFTALSLFAATRRWGFGLDSAREAEPGARWWTLVFSGAIGLGFLCKGPVILLWVGLPIVGFLATQGRLGSGLRILFDRRSLILFAALAVIWPLAVSLRYPAAVGVWWLEIAQKTGAMGVEHGNARGSILPEALAMSLPWTPLVLVALLAPIQRWRQGDDAAEPAHPNLSLAWWWAFAPLAVLGTWDVAKPNYYLPALPALAILVGDAWLRLARRARDLASGALARGSLQLAWCGLFASAVIAPVVANELAPAWRGWTLAASFALGASTLASVCFWRSGRDAASLASTATGLVAVVLIAYGAVAPTENEVRGHRALASRLSQILPPGTSPWFFDDLDEGLWFYGPRFDLKPVPALGVAAPRLNRGFALRSTVKPGQNRAEVAEARTRQAVDQLTTWGRPSRPRRLRPDPSQAPRSPEPRPSAPVRPGPPRSRGQAKTSWSCSAFEPPPRSPPCPTRPGGKPCLLADQRPRPSNQDLLARPKLRNAPDLAAGRKLPLLGVRVVIRRGFDSDNIRSYKDARGGPQDVRSLIEQGT